MEMLPILMGDPLITASMQEDLGSVSRRYCAIISISPKPTFYYLAISPKPASIFEVDPFHVAKLPVDKISGTITSIYGKYQRLYHNANKVKTIKT